VSTQSIGSALDQTIDLRAVEAHHARLGRLQFLRPKQNLGKSRRKRFPVLPAERRRQASITEIGRKKKTLTAVAGSGS
jgi:hypothetical protein